MQNRKEERGEEILSSMQKHYLGLVYPALQPRESPTVSIPRMRVTEDHRGSHIASAVLLDVTAVWKEELEGGGQVNHAKAFTWKYYFRKAHFSGNCSRSIHQV